MRIKRPDETVLVGDTTMSTLLETVRANRQRGLKRFLYDEGNWTVFLSDNERLSADFERENNYAPSHLDYSTIRNALINLYDSSSKYDECKFIVDARERYKNIICPYCGQGVCSTLDHYFDKDSFSELSLNVWNLIPSCGDCNFKKLNKKIDSPSERFFHPFFDDFFRAGEEMKLYYVEIEIFPADLLFLLNLKAHPQLDFNTISIVNWHIKSMDTASRNGVIIRNEFRYWANKIRTQVARLSSEELINDYLKAEKSYEIDFSWRGVVINSILASNLNFTRFCTIVNDQNYSINE